MLACAAENHSDSYHQSRTRRPRRMARPIVIGPGARPDQAQRQGVSARKKLKTINYFRDHGIKATMARFYSGVSEQLKKSKYKQVYRWAKERSKIEAECAGPTKGAKMKSRHKGTATSLPASAERDLVRWINELREDGVPVTTEMLRVEALEAAASAGIEGFAAGPTWTKLFRARHRLSLRSRTRKGQMAPVDAERIASEFSSNVKAVMNDMGITKVFNADQTAVLFEYLPKKTIHNRGDKTVWVRSSNKDKDRVTVMLLGDDNGNKYPPTVVMKTPPSTVPDVAYENGALRHGFGERVWNEIEALQDETGMNIYANSQGWWNSALSVEFLRIHFSNRERKDEPILLLWDVFSGHWTPEVVAYAKRINVVLLKVPPGATAVSQPADAAWIKPLKDQLRKAWVASLRDQLKRRDPAETFRLMPPSRRAITYWVKEAWEALPRMTIIDGYKLTGLAVSASDKMLIDSVNELVCELELVGLLGEDEEIDSDLDFDK